MWSPWKCSIGFLFWLDQMFSTNCMWSCAVYMFLWMISVQTDSSRWWSNILWSGKQVRVCRQTAVMIHCNWDRCLSSNSQLTHNGVKITILGVCNKQWLLEGRVSDPEQTSDTVVGRRIPDQILIDGTQIVETCCHHTSLITPTCFLIKTAPLWMRSGAHLLYWAETCVCVCLNWHAACVCLCLYTLQSLFVLVSCESLMSGISEGQTHTYEAIWHACFMCATVSIYVLWLIVKCLLSASKQFQTSSSAGSSVWKVCSSLQTIPNEFGKCPVLCHQQVGDSIYTGSKPMNYHSNYLATTGWHLEVYG